jgi:hypothetical protein
VYIKEGIIGFTKVVASLFLLCAGIILVGARPAKYSEETVTGPSQGNHELNCTVIRPWVSPPGPNQGTYPIIVWANGWGYNDVAGDFITDGYKPSLIEWALDGPYIVIAANQWSVKKVTCLIVCTGLLIKTQKQVVNTKV